MHKKHTVLQKSVRFLRERTPRCVNFYQKKSKFFKNVKDCRKCGSDRHDAA